MSYVRAHRPTRAVCRIAALTLVGLASTTIGAAAAAAAVSAGWGEPPARRADNGFAFVRGTDTLFSERWSRSPSVVEGTLTLTGQARIQYTLDLAGDATVSRMRLRVFPAIGATQEPAQTADATFRGDTLVAIQRAGARADTVRRATPRGTIPYLPPSMALFEQIIRRAKTIGGVVASVPVHLLAQEGGAQTLLAQVRYPTADSAVVTFANVPTSFHVAADGTILGIPTPDATIRVVRLVR